MVNLNQHQALKIGRILNTLRFNRPKNLLPQIGNPEDDLFFLFITVGICHQINWDFLTKTLNHVRLETPAKFTPEYLKGITHEELLGWLSAYPRKERVVKKMQRAALVRDMARFILNKYEGKVLNLFNRGKTIGGKGGLYSLLAKTTTYGEDPLRKKASVLIDFTDELRLVKFTDWQNFLPPIDYHIVRILLRTGVVEVLNKNLLAKLMTYQPVSEKEDVAIRRACAEAVIYMAAKDAKRRKIIDGLLWAIGRDCCHEESPRCKSCNLNSCFGQKYVLNRCRGDCFLKESCLAFQKERALLKLREQNFISTWY